MSNKLNELILQITEANKKVHTIDSSPFQHKPEDIYKINNNKPLFSVEDITNAKKLEQNKLTELFHLFNKLVSEEQLTNEEKQYYYKQLTKVFTHESF